MPSQGQTQAFSEPAYAKPDTAEKPPWYLPNINKHLLPETQELLESYSKIPRDQQSQHVHQIRDRAWDIRSYPCTGLGLWLAPYISHSPAYSSILKRLQAGDTLMDIGCFLGGDMRRLVFDGAPSENMYGVDIVNHWDVGLELFQDRDAFKAHFIEADMLSTDTPSLLALKGRADVIYISAVIHQWARQEQFEAGKKLVAFSKPGSQVVGWQMGNLVPQAFLNKHLKVAQWRHDPASFAKMWNSIGAETGTSWQIEAHFRAWEELGCNPREQRWLEPGDQMLDFVVTRTS